MEYLLTPHAKARLAERSIPEKLIGEALWNPTAVSYNGHGRMLIKKLYRKRRRERLLLIAGEMMNSTLKIITVIDTSKVKKYL